MLCLFLMLTQLNDRVTVSLAITRSNTFMPVATHQYPIVAASRSGHPGTSSCSKSRFQWSPGRCCQRCRTSSIAETKRRLSIGLRSQRRVRTYESGDQTGLAHALLPKKHEFEFLHLDTHQGWISRSKVWISHDVERAVSGFVLRVCDAGPTGFDEEKSCDAAVAILLSY